MRVRGTLGQEPSKWITKPYQLEGLTPKKGKRTKARKRKQAKKITKKGLKKQGKRTKKRRTGTKSFHLGE